MSRIPKQFIKRIIDIMKNAELIGLSCQITVKMKTILPLAEYLSDGYWIITTIVNFRFSIVCQNSSPISSAFFINKTVIQNVFVLTE
jgi:hypothetical protein